MYFISGTDDVVGPEGMEKFCEDIGVEPENVSLTDWVEWTIYVSHRNFLSLNKKAIIKK